jgi:carboxymethylenebutenolidase
MSGTRIEIKTEDGVAPAFEFGAHAAAKVLLLIDGIGMRPAMHELAERLAAAGYQVLMPDLFYRLGDYTAPDPRQLFSDPEVRAAWWGRHHAANSTPTNLLRDIRAYLDHFGNARWGVTGYCMGGRLSMLAAATYPERIAAAAAYHPGGLVTDGPDSPHLQLGRIRARVYIGAASEDPNFTDAQRKMVEEALTAGGVEHVMELYPARHGWVPSDTPVHDAKAAERHWETLLGLLWSAL